MDSGILNVNAIMVCGWSHDAPAPTISNFGQQMKQGMTNHPASLCLLLPLMIVTRSFPVGAFGKFAIVDTGAASTRYDGIHLSGPGPSAPFGPWCNTIVSCRPLLLAASAAVGSIRDATYDIIGCVRVNAIF